MLKLDTDVERTGDRLKSERKRLKKTQLEFAQWGEITRQTQQLYEAADRFPSYEYLVRLSQHDVDVVYVMTGLRNLVSSPSSEDATATKNILAQLRAVNETYSSLNDQISANTSRQSELLDSLKDL